MNRPTRTNIPIILEKYMNYIILTKGRTESTAEEYVSDIMLFFKYIKVQLKIVSKDTDYSDILLDDIDEEFVSKITMNNILNFLLYLKNKRQYSKITQRRKIAAIRSYFDYAHNIGKYSNIDITKKLRLPDPTETMPIYIGNKESALLINSINSRNSIRDKMIIALFLHTGIKLMELCNLKITDIEGDQLIIINNNRIDRCIPLDDMLLKYLGIYLSWRYKKYIDIPLSNKDKYSLFLSEQKKKISPRTVQDIVLKATRNAMLKKQISSQKLRHSYAVFLYKKGFSLKEIQKMLGHENICSTQIYLNIPELNMNNNFK